MNALKRGLMNVGNPWSNSVMKNGLRVRLGLGRMNCKIQIVKFSSDLDMEVDR